MINKYIGTHSGLLDFSSPKIMGIINITPDSFFDGGIYNDIDEAVNRAIEMKQEGVDIIDIGGMSTRPYAKDVSLEDEEKRILPIIKAIRYNIGKEVFISVDTFRQKVAEKAIKLGADIINDVFCGGLDKNMHDFIVDSKTPYVVNHNKGSYKTMQNNPSYKDILYEVTLFLSKKLDFFYAKGNPDIIIDPGFGFGKSLDDNYTMLNNLKHLKMFNTPILVGLSRKSMITKYLGIKPEESLVSSAVLNYQALINGANIIRTHDVKETKQIVRLLKKMN